MLFIYNMYLSNMVCVSAYTCILYTERLKKPDTFCFPLTRTVQILELNVNANFITSKSIFEQNLFTCIQYKTWR